MVSDRRPRRKQRNSFVLGDLKISALAINFPLNYENQILVWQRFIGNLEIGFYRKVMYRNRGDRVFIESDLSKWRILKSKNQLVLTRF